MFLYIVGHKPKQRILKIDFYMLQETINRYFNKVLGFISQLHDGFMRQASN